MTTTETQAFLDEMKEPSVQPHGEARSAIAAFVPEAGQTLQQVARLRQLLAAADVAEDEAEVRQQFYEGFQALGALEREINKAEEAARKGAAVLRELDDWFNRLSQVASSHGYDV